jgi:protein-S-isoprenylcysteine O-methyltransferase Ste14
MNTFKTLLYMGSLHGFLTFYFPYQLALRDDPFFEPGLFRFLALPLWLAGTLIIIRCCTDLIHKGRGTPAFIDPPSELVITGLYRYVRNPIYSGALLVHLGTILWFASGLMILYFLVFALAFHGLVVLFEEPVLRQTFGTSYADYCKRVPRWLPKIRSSLEQV